jgi:hypothetical protein
MWLIHIWQEVGHKLSPTLLVYKKFDLFIRGSLLLIV